MKFDFQSTKLRNTFGGVGIIGILLIFTPVFMDGRKYQNCIDRVGIDQKDLCELPQQLNLGATIDPMIFKLIGVASMIIGALFIFVSAGYFVIKILKKEVSKMRKDVADSELGK